jgi:hypothetical protein
VFALGSVTQTTIEMGVGVLGVEPDGFVTCVDSAIEVSSIEVCFRLVKPTRHGFGLRAPK